MLCSISRHLCGSWACWDKRRQHRWHGRAISSTRDTDPPPSSAVPGSLCSALLSALLECSLGRHCLWGRGIKKHRCGTSGSWCWESYSPSTASGKSPSLLLHVQWPWGPWFMAPPHLTFSLLVFLFYFILFEAGNTQITGL